MSRAAIVLCCMVCAAFAGTVQAAAQETDTSIAALEGGISVPVSVIPTTGAVLLQYELQTGATILCSGMLVSPAWVLTAAHRGVARGDTVTLGNFLDANAPTARVQEIFRHPGWRSDDDKPEFDVGLVRLQGGAFPPAFRRPAVGLVPARPVSRRNEQRPEVHGECLWLRPDKRQFQYHVRGPAIRPVSN